MREFARNLQKIRIERGFSQDQVAYASGLSRSSYQRLERGEASSGVANNPTLRNLVAVAQVLNVTVEQLVPMPLPEVQSGAPMPLKRRRIGRAD
jgi:transcriptional regulator with XRE-family HTH domain